MACARYTEEQRRFVAARYEYMTSDELSEEFRVRFPGATWDRKYWTNYAKSAGLRKSKETLRRCYRQRSDRMRLLTPEQLEWLRSYVPGHEEREVRSALVERYGVELSRSQYRNVKQKMGLRSGTHGGRFEPGHEAPNKGKTWDEFMTPEGQQRVRESGNLFAKGHVPHNAYHRLLDTRMDEGGCLLIYVKPRNARNSADNWISYARYVWMQHNGREFPERHRCVFCDRDVTNYAPENLMAVSEDVYAIVIGGLRGQAIEYHDRETLELAVLHARVIHRRRQIMCEAPRTCAVCGRMFVVEAERLHNADKVRTCADCRAKGLRAGRRIERDRRETA